jgi:hypothetical protein
MVNVNYCGICYERYIYCWECLSYVGSLRSVIGCLFSIYYSFMNQYRVCILYGNYVDLFECTYAFHGREFEFGSSALIDGMYVVALAHAAITMSGATFQPLVLTLLMSG